MEIAKQERTRASVSRSVALYQDFVEAVTVRKLRELLYDIEHIIWEKKFPVAEKDEPIVVFNETKFADKLYSIRQALIGVLQRLNLIYRCGKFEKKHKQKQPQIQYAGLGDGNQINVEDQGGLCDRSTISILIGPIFTEFFYAFRAITYCDDFFQMNYSGYVQKWENMVADHQERDASNMEFVVFRKQSQWQDAVDSSARNKDDRNYTILRLDKERCKLFKAETGTESDNIPQNKNAT